MRRKEKPEFTIVYLADDTEGFELELTTGDRLQISQSKRKQFMQALTRYFGGGVDKCRPSF